ncbi:ABC transporter substrate-binding protein [Amycolatopsis alkalitolerans]|uniref:ABC transporter substrate-binding protein n=1 Tax=Amycolatopsis alkalitolerans TaxID=2547244 RepID=A0A5C4M5H4_9PSEU|nr:ABC transporter substrate-binding protein [Amycolatopsis alkalitolerans]TNC28055.1 ABC transporter substrate-binding protein [Amycolatopsis alkalitolerans]
MIRRGTLACGAVALTTALLLSACGGGASSGSGTATTGALTGRGPITFATGKDTSGNLDKLVNTWNTQHPTENVRVVELPESADDQLQQMVQNAQIKSDAFSVLDMDVTWTAEFAAHRWIDQLPQDQLNLPNYLPSAVATGKYRGNLYAMPFKSNGGLLFYRKDLLQQAGVQQPPKTFADMFADCQKVMALPQAAGMGCYAGQYAKYEGLTVNFSEAVDSAGGSVFDDNGNPTVDTPQAKTALNTLVQAFKSGSIPKDAITYKEEDSRRAFEAGKLVFQRQWPYGWALGNKAGSSQVAGKFDVAPLPGITGQGVSTLGGYNLAISAFTKNKATALDFIKYLTSADAERSNLLATSEAPTLTALYNDQTLTKKFPYLPTLQQSIETAKPRPQAVSYGDVSSAIQESVYAALTGQKSTDQALSELQQKLQQLTQQK